MIYFLLLYIYYILKYFICKLLPTFWEKKILHFWWNLLPKALHIYFYQILNHLIPCGFGSNRLVVGLVRNYDGHIGKNRWALPGLLSIWSFVSILLLWVLFSILLVFGISYSFWSWPALGSWPWSLGRVLPVAPFWRVRRPRWAERPWPSIATGLAKFCTKAVFFAHIRTSMVPCLYLFVGVVFWYDAAHLCCRCDQIMLGSFRKSRLALCLDRLPRRSSWGISESFRKAKISKISFEKPKQCKH